MNGSHHRTPMAGITAALAAIWFATAISACNPAPGADPNSSGNGAATTTPKHSQAKATKTPKSSKSPRKSSSPAKQATPDVPSDSVPLPTPTPPPPKQVTPDVPTDPVRLPDPTPKVTATPTLNLHEPIDPNPVPPIIRHIQSPVPAAP
jgi:hypothetical protein